jgi:xylulose-5-phosphate/fructose-6-phosphate phosphoketolase
LIVASKNEMPQWLTLEQAREHAARGASAWDFAGHGSGTPHVILACAGDTPTLETLAASELLARIAPDLVTRVVNVFDLFALASRDDHAYAHGHPHGLEDAAFDALFEDREVVFAFHGYPLLASSDVSGLAGAARQVVTKLSPGARTPTGS